MSIYSGFATRQQQQAYDEYLQSVLYILQKRLLKFYKNQEADEEKFISVLIKLHSQMKSMETHKYLQPKSSNSIQQLLNFLKQKTLDDIEEQNNYQLNTNTLQNMEISFTAPITNTGVIVSKRTNEKQINETQQQSSHNSGTFVMNEKKQKNKILQPRPNTNNNKIRKREVNRSFSNSINKCKDLLREGIKQQGHDKHINASGNLQHIFNGKASKLVGMSQNHKRENHNISQQSSRRRKFSMKCTQPAPHENIQNIADQNKTKYFDVRDLIKDYISKTKKNYLKKLNRTKQEMQQMMRID